MCVTLADNVNPEGQTNVLVFPADSLFHGGNVLAGVIGRRCALDQSTNLTDSTELLVFTNLVGRTPLLAPATSNGSAAFAAASWCRGRNHEPESTRTAV